MKYAIFQTGGKQYKAVEGGILEVERLLGEPNKALSFDTVMLYVFDGTCAIGKPYLDGVSIKGTILEHIKGEKLSIAKYKAKVRYRRMTGHRQSLTRVKIDEIKENFIKQSPETVKAEKPKKAAKAKEK